MRDRNKSPSIWLGESKKESLGRDQNLSIEIPSSKIMNSIAKIVKSYGSNIKIRG